MASEAALQELASVAWRPRADERELRRAELLWALTTVAHALPLLALAGFLVVLEPFLAPLSALCLVQAWIVPALYAQRGANVLKPPARADDEAERRAVGLLGDLVGHDARDLHRQTGVVMERRSLGLWLVAGAGAVLIRPGGRRVHCYCVRVPEPGLPAGDRIAHLLLALRSDEHGFATVANRAFAGARWRLRRRLPARLRHALDAGARAARRDDAAE
jgi:hypothetical protein